MELINLIDSILIWVNLPLLILLSIWFIILLLPEKKLRKIRDYPMVSVIIPVYNESETIEECINSIKGNDYPKDKLEVIVVDDSSTDGTYEKASKMGVKLIRTEKVGKVGSLNEGLKLAKGDIIITVDGDTFIPKDGIKRIVNQFSEKDVGVVEATVSMSGESILERFQKIEFSILSPLLERHNWINILPFLGGQVCGFRREALKDVGGFQSGTISEDSDTYVQVINSGWKSRCARIDAKTRPERKITNFLRQRRRWMLGGLQVLVKHIKPKKLSVYYPVLAMGTWSIFLSLSLIFNAYVFFYWFRDFTLRGIITYIVRWVSFIGVPLGYFQLPTWGWPLTATIGISVGLVSFLVILAGIGKSRREFDAIDLILAVFYPVYGWVLMGISGIWALCSFLINPKQEFNSTRGDR